MKIINLTPHNITILTDSGERMDVPKSGTVARVSTTPGERSAMSVNGCNIAIQAKDRIGDVTGLPEPQDGTIYLVSGFVGSAVSRPDVFVPGTAPADNPERNEKGHIVAVRVIKATV